jgi:ketosteroid isomerase-like protein
MPTTDDQIRELGRRWARAEQQGDAEALDALSADDFTLVGPVGFVLSKQQWLDRYRTAGGLAIESLDWDEVQVREYGDTAVAVGVHTQRGELSGRPIDGTFRATHIAVRRGDDWVLAGMHLSPIGGPPPFAPRAE